MQEAVKCNDDGALCDVLSCVSQRTRELTLDSFVLLLPRLSSLLESRNEDHAIASMQSVQLMIRTFSDLIARTRAMPIPTGVDITLEERKRKVNLIVSELQACSTGGGLGMLRKRPGKVGALARGVIASIDALS